MLDNFFSSVPDGLTPQFLIEFLTFILICNIIFMILDIINKFKR